MKREILAWGPAVFWALVLLSLSRLRSVPPVFDPLRVIPSELIHFAMYLVLGATLAYGRRVTVFLMPHLLVIAVGSAYGAVDEWHQSFVPGRTPSVTDWVVDVIGVVVGYALIMLLPATFFPARRRGSGAGAGIREHEHTEGT